MKKIIVVGSGFSGSVIARKIAEDMNRPVIVLEKRNHIAGNMFDEIDGHSILVQRYGPHIVCTNRWEIIEYLGRYSKMFRHTVKLLSFIDGNYVRLPFNFESIQQFLGGEEAKKLIADLRKEFHARDRIPVLELVNSSNPSIAKFGDFLFEKSYRNYCAKQWNIPVNSIDKTVMDRVPMVIGYDERYMNKDFQYLPKEGFTELFRNLLNHPNISVNLNIDALKHIILDDVNKRVLFDGEEVELLVFTGPVDELLGLKYGELSYRSLDIHYEWFDKKRELPSEIVSYPQADGYTRRTEYKYLMYDNSAADGTITATEFPCAYIRNNMEGRVGINNLSVEANNLGVGVESLGIGVNNLSIEANNLGVRVESLGVGVNNLGVGVNNLGVGVESLVIGVNNLGVGVNNLSIEANNLGVGVESLDVGVNNLGVGVESLDVGVNNLGIEANNLGVGVESLGVEANNLGIEANNLGVGVESLGVEANNLGIEADNLYGRGGTEPFYPVLTEENRIRYECYRKEIETYRNIFLCGRLAEFKYYNMDDCILRAFDVFEKIKNLLKTSGGECL